MNWNEEKGEEVIGGWSFEKKMLQSVLSEGWKVWSLGETCSRQYNTITHKSRKIFIGYINMTVVRCNYDMRRSAKWMKL